MSTGKPPKRYPICGVKTRKGTPCQLPAGHKIDHAGEGRCKLHADRSCGPKDRRRGNKNALKHGAYETIVRDALTEGERELFDEVPSCADLSMELRINRFKLLRLLRNVEQNLVAGFSVRTMKADELAKIDAIVKLSDNIRKLAKDSVEAYRASDDPLERALWELRAMRAERKERRREGSP